MRRSNSQWPEARYCEMASGDAHTRWRRLSANKSTYFDDKPDGRIPLVRRQARAANVHRRSAIMKQ